MGLSSVSCCPDLSYWRNIHSDIFTSVEDVYENTYFKNMLIHRREECLFSFNQDQASYLRAAPLHFRETSLKVKSAICFSFAVVSFPCMKIISSYDKNLWSQTYNCSIFWRWRVSFSLVFIDEDNLPAYLLYIPKVRPRKSRSFPYISWSICGSSLQPVPKKGLVKLQKYWKILSLVIGGHGSYRPF